MDVYVIVDEKPLKLDPAEHGFFYSDDIYIIDLKGKKHRYVLTWMGPRLNALEITHTSTYMDIVTNYENSSTITRQRVSRGHEDESLLSLFPHGFIIYNGKRIEHQDKLNYIYQYGGLFRISAPYGDASKAIEQSEVSCQKLNSGDAFFLVGAGGQSYYLWLGEGANEPEQTLGRKLLEYYGYNATVKLEFKEG